MRLLLPFTVLACFLVLACFNACRKGPIPCFGTQADIKNWMYFRTGSYFVYEEENTGAIDCLIVVNSSVSDPLGVGSDRSPYFLTRYESPITGNSYLDYVYPGGVSACDIDCVEGHRTCVTSKREKSNPGNSYGPTNYFLFHPAIGSVSINGGGAMVKDTVKCVQINSSYELNDSTYAEVVVFTHSNDYIEGEQGSIIYIGKNYGIVRKELIDSGEAWNLVRWNIIQ